MFRKGTTLIRKLVLNEMGRLKPTVVPLTDDIIGDRFWKENPEVIGLKSLGTYQPPVNAPLVPGGFNPAAVNSVTPPMPLRPMLPNNVIQAHTMINSVPSKKTIESNHQDANREPSRNGDAAGHK